MSTTDLLYKHSNKPELAANSDEYFLACIDLVRLASPVLPLYAAELWTGLASTELDAPIMSNYDFQKDIFDQAWPDLHKLQNGEKVQITE